MELDSISVGDIAAVAALLVAIVAAVIAGLAKREARRSADAAEDSATASKRSAAAAETSAQADATMARLAEEEANRYTIPWRIEHDAGQRYRLVHDNHDETAHEVNIEGPAVHHVEPKDTLGPQESMLFMLVPAMGLSRDVTIRWRRPTDPEGEERSYTTQPPAAR